MRKSLFVAMTAACALVLGTSAMAADGSIAVYVDDAGTICATNIGGPVTQGSVWMNLSGATAGGITGAEFRIDNSNPSAYAVAFTADPAAVAVVGNPLLGGVNVAFAACQPGVSGRVKLGTILILEATPANDVTLTVRQHFTPNNQDFPCALAVLCDEPVYSKVCLGAPNSDHWRAWLNPSEGVSGTCEPVAVEPSSWSRVKALFN